MGRNGAPVCHQPLVLQKIMSEVLEVCYEALIAEPEMTCRALID